MSLEIERKFLVANDSWKSHVTESRRLVDALVSVTAEGMKVRVRIVGDEATLTVKSKRRGLTRDEFEYPIPLADAHKLVEHCEGRVFAKVRHYAPWGEHVWEIDVYEDLMAGVILAELELDAEDEDFLLPPWAGAEVSSDAAYSKRRLFEQRLSARPVALVPR